MYVCMYVCMYVYMSVFIHLCRMYVRMHVSILYIHGILKFANIKDGQRGGGRGIVEEVQGW